MTTWRYLCVFVAEEHHAWVSKNLPTELHTETLAALLTEVGAQGWELVSLTPAIGTGENLRITEFWATFKQPQA